MSSPGPASNPCPASTFRSADELWVVVKLTAAWVSRATSFPPALLYPDLQFQGELFLKQSSSSPLNKYAQICMPESMQEHTDFLLMGFMCRRYL